MKNKKKRASGLKTKFRLNIFFVILFLLTVFSGIPIIVLMNQSFSNLDRSREVLKATIETTVKEQTRELYKLQAKSLAKRISEFLNSCETDLKDFATLPPDPQLFLEFSKNNMKWVSSLKEYKPLYKEIAFIDKTGQEILKITDNKIVDKSDLKNVSEPKNTTYLSESYFQKTRSSSADIYVGHFKSWYVSRQEQLEQNKKLDGIIRFNKKLKTADGKFNGVCMIALDAVHLLDFINYSVMGKDAVIKNYKTGSYNYLVDDEGWIIAHQKLWDIKGFRKDGTLVEPLTEETPDWKFASGIIPINLLKMDWRLKDYETQEPMSSIIERVRRGECVITTMKSMGIHNEVEGIVRTRAYAPIIYSAGSFYKYGVFGMVSVGTSLKDFNDNMQILSSELANIHDESKSRTYFITFSMFAAVLIFSFLIARWIARPMNKLTITLMNIGKGNYNVERIKSYINEIKVLSGEVVDLAGELKSKEEKINRYVKDVELVNQKLDQAKKELSVYWQREYESEPDTILEEKIKLYEEEYPALRELRQEKCIGVSPAYLRVLRLVVPQSQMNIPTWIYGESGVGKSSLAYVIHALSPRADRPFYVFGASEFAAADPLVVLGKLFGYGPGHGLTGIDKEGQPGILEECHGGTLLIDDVDSLPLDTQSQLLRVVDGLDFHYAAGKSKSISVDVRFLFASNVNLEQSVKEGRFRKDLYRRIGGSFNQIAIPALRKRKSDIPLLANYFVQTYCSKHNADIKLSERALDLLCKHDYREGNIGELKTLIEVACERSRIEGEGVISLKHFPSIIGAVTTEMNWDDDQGNENIFNQDELNMLSVLRDNLFRMDICEVLLGYKPGSHTLSHYLRGISLKALSHADWEIESATNLVTGSDLNGKTKRLVRSKIEGYIENIKSKKNVEQENKLYKNLPKEYHKYLNSALRNLD